MSTMVGEIGAPCGAAYRTAHRQRQSKYLPLVAVAVELSRAPALLAEAARSERWS